VANNGEQFGELPNRGGRRVFNTDGQTFQESGYDYKEGDLNREAVDKLKNLGRFPANLMHDGSQQVLDLFPSNAGAAAPVKSGHSGESNGIYNDYAQRGDDGATFYGDKGSAARFFYCPKATKKDRDEGCDELETKEKPAHMRTGNGTGEASMESGWPATQRKNTHPTVKPTELMRYLCRLITPPGGTVLDPFNGSGSTGKAALKEGFSYVGIEKEAEYLRIAEARIRSSL
jgi:site-specific DNA-methyltransferase (adenine-specific)